MLHFGSRTYFICSQHFVVSIPYIYREYRVESFEVGHDCPSAHKKVFNSKGFRIWCSVVSEPITGERWFFGKLRRPNTGANYFEGVTTRPAETGSELRRPNRIGSKSRCGK